MERNHEDEWSLHAGSSYLGMIDKFFFSLKYCYYLIEICMVKLYQRLQHETQLHPANGIFFPFPFPLIYYCYH